MEADTNVTGSLALTSKSRLDMTRVTKAATSNPIAIPLRTSARTFVTTSLTMLPWPTWPSHTVLRPIASKAGRSGLAADSGPEARMSSWPCSAGPLLPETGASTNVTPGRTAASRSRKPRVAWTPIVPICAHTLPSANAAATPPSKMTDSTAAAVGSMVITTSASRTAPVTGSSSYRVCGFGPLPAAGAPSM